MFNCDLIVLSYHRFTKMPDSYEFSRTYDQFAVDLRAKDYDWITIDDGHQSMIQACAMMRERNIRGKLFISTSLVGEAGYCTWTDIVELSKFHDIENHSHFHKRLPWLEVGEIEENITTASVMIKERVGRSPRYFVPPWNAADKRVETAAGMFGMTLVRNRIDMTNSTP